MTHRLERILKRTSRSFWLSIRALPGPMREGVALGYLLARLTDTVADGIARDPAGQRRVLEGLDAEIQGRISDRRWWRDLGNFAGTEISPAEEQLLKQAAALLRELELQPDPVRAQLRWVLRHIVEGQRWDLGRFPPHPSPVRAGFPDGGEVEDPERPRRKLPGDEVTGLQGDAELLRYCWRVAGSVGEFWGRLGVATLGARFAGPRPDEVLLARLGGRYGEALQLINILRDLPEDWPKRRCYLPGRWTSADEAWERAGPQWLAAARERLQAASQYAGLLRGRRLRLATALPAAIGWETLRRLERASFQELDARVKVPRAGVRRLLREGLWACRSGGASRAWLRRLEGAGAV